MKDFQAQREAFSPAALQTRNVFFISFSVGYFAFPDLIQLIKSRSGLASERKTQQT